MVFLSLVHDEEALCRPIQLMADAGLKCCRVRGGLIQLALVDV